MIFAILADSDCSNFAQEHLIIFVVPKVISMSGTEEVTITFDSILAEYRHIHLVKNLCILSDICSITKHKRHFVE